MQSAVRSLKLTHDMRIRSRYRDDDDDDDDAQATVEGQGMEYVMSLPLCEMTMLLDDVALQPSSLHDLDKSSTKRCFLPLIT
jgi:hypothetical protein